MGTPFLYLATILIWGTTWIAITYQLGSAAPTTSVMIRFGLASALLFSWCALRRIPLRFTARQHSRAAAQGACLFGLNLLFVYIAERTIPSGVTSVLFTALIPMNLVGSRVFFGTAISRRTWLGAALGLIGVALVFLPEVTEIHSLAASLTGLTCALVGTMFASAGNLLSVRNQKAGMPILQTNAYGMAYGAATVGLVGLVSGESFHVEWSPAYSLSLLYLSVFGSILAFGAYLTLISRIGAGRAAYTGVLFPLVALGISTVWEHYHWTPSALVGVACCVAGSVFMNLRRPNVAATGAIAAPKNPINQAAPTTS
jgi:drug/metabolite transporter (DMT)-like permease